MKKLWFLLLIPLLWACNSKKEESPPKIDRYTAPSLPGVGKTGEPIVKGEPIVLTDTLKMSQDTAKVRFVYFAQTVDSIRYVTFDEGYLIIRMFTSKKIEQFRQTYNTIYDRNWKPIAPENIFDFKVYNW